MTLCNSFTDLFFRRMRGVVAFGFTFWKTLRTMRLRKWRLKTLAVACAMPLCAIAALGEAPFVQGASSAVDARVAVYRAAQTAQGYKVWALELNNGTVVKEFVDLSGQVFALRWSGPDLPDMDMLLGSYLPVFKSSVQAARKAGKRGGPVVVQSGGLVLVSTGVMGAFQGYAYVESLVPLGLDVRSLLK